MVVEFFKVIVFEPTLKKTSPLILLYDAENVPVIWSKSLLPKL